MIPTATGIRKMSTFDGQRIDMTLDTDSLAHIMSVLTNLYSDPEMAVLREYSCNARDSHIAAGNDAPIEVVLPSPLRDSLTITDYGVGLSLEDIENIYSRYGSSTKRGTDSQTGMLGLGSKSALTYAEQFTVTATKDGVRAKVLVSVKADGAGTMTVLDTRNTDAPNGVSIDIPVKSNNEFAEKAARLFRFWPEGSVLVNGEQPKPLEGKRVGNMVVYRNDRFRHYRDHTVVMGGVPYPAGRDLSSMLSNTGLWADLTLFVPMGAVDFVPSREELHFTPRTTQYLKDALSDVMSQIHAAAQAEIDAAPDKPTALRIAEQWRAFGRIETPSSGRDDFTYKSEKVPTTFRGSHMVYNANSSYRNKWSRSDYIDTASVGQAVLVWDYLPESTPSPATRAKVTQWMADNGHENREIWIFAPKQFVGEWSNAIVVDYPTIKGTKLPRAVVGGSNGQKRERRTVNEWSLYTTNNGVADASIDDISASRVVLVSPADLAKDYAFHVPLDHLASRLRSDEAIVVANKNRHERFAREFGGEVIHVKDRLLELRREFEATITARDYALISWAENANSNAYRLAISIGADLGDKINDKALLAELRDVESICDRFQKGVDSLTTLSRMFHESVGYEIRKGLSDLVASEHTLTMDKYPMLMMLCLPYRMGHKIQADTPQGDEVVWYLNARHESLANG